MRYPARTKGGRLGCRLRQFLLGSMCGGASASAVLARILQSRTHMDVLSPKMEIIDGDLASAVK